MCSPSETRLNIYIYIYIYLFIYLFFIIFIFILLYIVCILIVVLSLFSMICMALIEDQSETNKLIKLSRCGLVRAGLFLELLVYTG